MAKGTGTKRTTGGSAEGGKTSKGGRASKATKAAEPTKAAKPSKPAKAAEPSKAAKPSKPAKPSKTTKAAEPSKAAKPSKTTKAPEPSKAAKPSTPAKAPSASTRRRRANLAARVVEEAATAPQPKVTRSRYWKHDVADVLRAGPGYRLADLDTSATPGWKGDRKAAEKHVATLGSELSELQERLFADGRTGGSRSVLLVLQGLDTAGKGGIVRHVIGLVDPQGVALRSFGVPTAEERRHHYLWRIRRALPPAGKIGVFDRSHYEDVLVAKVEQLAPAAIIDSRYDEITRFERQVVARGTAIVKVALMVSAQEQLGRLRERLEKPDKLWKFNPGDLDTRSKFPAYLDAYQTVLDRTSTDEAPWYVVPADKKWYARLAVSELLARALRGLDLEWPTPDYDVAQMLARLDTQTDVGR